MVKLAGSKGQTETVTHININQCEVLLKVVPINIYGPNGIISATALLDDVSTVSFIKQASPSGPSCAGAGSVNVCAAPGTIRNWFAKPS